MAREGMDGVGGKRRGWMNAERQKAGWSILKTNQVQLDPF